MSQPQRIRGVLLDAVGTLIRVRSGVGAVYADVASRHGVSLPAARLEDAFARVLRGAPPMVFPEAPQREIPPLERAWWRDRVRETFRAADGTARFADFDAFFADLYEGFASVDAWRVVPGAREALEELGRAGRRTGVLSNFDQRLPRLLDALGLARTLACVVLPGEVRAAKPDPRIFAAGLARLDVRAEEAVYVGDDPEQDLAAAHRAGLAAIDVAELATLAELPDRIAALEKEKHR